MAHRRTSKRAGPDCYRLLGKVETECVQAMARSDPGATKGRLMWTRGVFAAKCWYLFKLQSPSPTDRKAILDRLQTVCDMSTMGTHTNFVRRTTATQTQEDGGFGHIDVHAHLHGEAIRLMMSFISNPAAPPLWQNFWMFQLKYIWTLIRWTTHAH